jgi:hypothetical protein
LSFRPEQIGTENPEELAGTFSTSRGGFYQTCPDHFSVNLRRFQAQQRRRNKMACQEDNNALDI